MNGFSVFRRGQALRGWTSLGDLPAPDPLNILQQVSQQAATFTNGARYFHQTPLPGSAFSATSARAPGSMVDPNMYQFGVSTSSQPTPAPTPSGGGFNFHQTPQFYSGSNLAPATLAPPPPSVPPPAPLPVQCQPGFALSADGSACVQIPVAVPPASSGVVISPDGAPVPMLTGVQSQIPWGAVAAVGAAGLLLFVVLFRR